MYVVIARYTVKEGKQDLVLANLKQVIPLSRAEPGNRAYIVNQSTEDPCLILLYEQYVDEAAFLFHAGREEFAEFVKGRVWPLLESCVREIYTTIEPDDSDRRLTQKSVERGPIRFVPIGLVVRRSRSMEPCDGRTTATSTPASARTAAARSKARR